MEVSFQTRKRLKRLKLPCPRDLYGKSPTDPPSDLEEALNASSEEEEEESEHEAASEPANESASNQLEESPTMISPEPENESTVQNSPGKEKVRYGGDLLHGEGAAIATFISKGVRIPRRGEIGYTSSQISNFESFAFLYLLELGYVMSGSRHRRMNAIRIRKENQVYSVEEERALAKIKHEEMAKRSDRLLEEFRKKLENAKKKTRSAKMS